MIITVSLGNNKFCFFLVMRTLKIYSLSNFQICNTAVKNPPVYAGHAGLISGLGRSSGEGNDHSLQYSCLEKSYGQRNLAGLHGIAKKGDTTY